MGFSPVQHLWGGRGEPFALFVWLSLLSVLDWSSQIERVWSWREVYSSPARLQYIQTTQSQKGLTTDWFLLQNLIKCVYNRVHYYNNKYTHVELGNLKLIQLYYVDYQQIKSIYSINIFRKMHSQYFWQWYSKMWNSIRLSNTIYWI